MSPTVRAILHALHQAEPTGLDLDKLGDLHLKQLLPTLDKLVKAGSVISDFGIYTISASGREQLQAGQPPSSAPPMPPLPFVAQTIVQRSVSDLKRDPRNARTHSPEQIEKLAGEIRAHGFTQPLLIDSKGRIIAGHGRLEAALVLGLREVPCIVLPHLNATQTRAVILADNRLAELAGWDDEILKAELDALAAVGVDLGDLGWDEDDLADLESRLKPEPDAGDDEEPPKSFDVIVSCNSGQVKRSVMKLLKSKGFACHPFNKNA